MSSPPLMSSLVVFLCTYLVHSTLLMAPTWFLIARRRRPADPGLRSRLLKLSMVAPLVTTITLTFFAGVHIGPQISLTRRAVPENVDSSTELLRSSSYEVHDVESTPSLEQASHEMSSPPTNFAERTPGLVDSSEDSTGEAVIVPAKSATKSIDWRSVGITSMTIVWLAIGALGLIRLVFQWLSLHRIRRKSTAVVDAALLEELERQRIRMGIHRRVALRTSASTSVPLAAGIVRPFILLPASLRAREHCTAMLAHELAHIASRDAVWNLLTQALCRVFFFQPFNWLTSKAIRQQMDFKADAMAANLLGESMSLVQCLYATGERLSGRHSVPSPAIALASGMAMFESTLGKRIEALLDADPVSRRAAAKTQVTFVLAMLLCTSSVALLAPRAVAEIGHSRNSFISKRNSPMNQTLATLLIFAGLSTPASAEEPQTPLTSEQEESARQSTVPDELPEGVLQFNGMLVGRVASKDVEKGSFTVTVDAVSRVWRNSRAENPRSIVGKTVEVSGVFGKFLDVLVVTRIGETLEFECKHDGDGLVFPGELLRKVAPYEPEDYPILPEAFRGFRGRVAAEIVKKDPETFEMIIRVEDVLDTWQENSAKEATSIEGKSMMLAGFWNRRDAYHDLKVGDRIDVGMQHIGLRSDHMTVAEAVRKLDARGEREMEREDRPDDRSLSRGERMERENPEQGFRGMLVGRLVEKDVERGTFTITVDAVPRVWENNRSRNPKALIGQNVGAEGVSGRMIDALVVAKVGDTIEFGALHEEGPRVRVGEVLRKVAPVEPGDYPVLPDGFRGFRGMVTGKVVRKGEELWELIVEVDDVLDSFDGNRADNPESIVGKQVMLAGFWNRRDDFHSIKVGDRIRCGMRHTQLLSDHLTVIESIRKVDNQ